jgi:cell shape-determining protein MreC
MKDRTTLALEACQGMSDKDLENRGPAGFVKMVLRKRAYAQAARTLNETAKAQAKRIQQLELENKILKTQVETLESFDAPVGDTTQAASMLAGIAGKKGGEA